MPTRMTGAEVAATRHLLGLSQQELATMLGINRNTIKDWERGAYSPRVEGVMIDLLALRSAHDQEAARLIQGAADGVPIGLPAGPKPRGWYLALGARVIAAVPDAMLDWASEG